jgi:cbb3-type cytochrome oxidase subunit 1
MLVGFFLSMVSGVCYHVLARWTGHRWRSVRLIKAHYYTTLLALPVMLIALATNRETLFSYAGPIQGLALWLFLWNIAPMVKRMTGPTRPALILAITSLLVGVFLGAWFAGHPVLGVRYRIVHADLNLFGWSGLLISGVAYYLVPRFFGRPLRWPHLAMVQIWLLAAGITVSSLAWIWRIEEGGSRPLIAIAQVAVAASFLLLGTIVSGTLTFGKAGVTISAVPIVKQFERRLPMT